MPGGICSAGCSCRGVNPECQGAGCGPIRSCNTGTGCIDPICGTTIEGGGVCLEGAAECDDGIPCTTSADCFGGVCVVNGCCGRQVCVSVAGVCPLP